MINELFPLLNDWKVMRSDISLTLFPMGCFGMCSHGCCTGCPLNISVTRNDLSIKEAFLAETYILCLHCLLILLFDWCHVMCLWHHFYDQPLESMQTRHIIASFQQKLFGIVYIDAIVYSYSVIVILKTK